VDFRLGVDGALHDDGRGRVARVALWRLVNALLAAPANVTQLTGALGVS
jgi:hypothetical protein